MLLKETASSDFYVAKWAILMSLLKNMEKTIFIFMTWNA